MSYLAKINNCLTQKKCNSQMSYRTKKNKEKNKEKKKNPAVQKQMSY